MNHVYLVGLGAIGASFGAQFVKHKQSSFKVLVNESRLGRYQEEGVKVNQQVVNFEYLVPNAQAPKGDLIIIATKYHQLNEALDLIEPVVGHHTQILSLLNGINSEAIIASRWLASYGLWSVLWH